MTENKIFIPNEILKGYGCKNCVWKTFHECPKGFTEPEQKVESGCCDEFASFILNMGEPDDKISAIMAKFHLYVLRIQTNIDHTEFSRLAALYKKRKLEGADRKELARIEMEMQTNKLWWARLNESVIKSSDKIADREQRKDLKIEHEHKVQLTQIHQIVNDTTKKLSESEDKPLKDGDKKIEVKDDEK